MSLAALTTIQPLRQAPGMPMASGLTSVSGCRAIQALMPHGSSAAPFGCSGNSGRAASLRLGPSAWRVNVRRMASPSRQSEFVPGARYHRRADAA